MNALALPAWRLAWRLLRRDWRSGELSLLSLSLVLTVAAISAVGFFTDRVEGAMQRQGGELIAADLAIDASSPIQVRFVDEAIRLGLTTAHTLRFPSVVVSGAQSLLVQVKAVDPGYPLRGEVRVQATLDQGIEPAEGGPRGDAAWVEPRLLHGLGLTVGDRFQLGQSSFRIERVIAYEPDRGGNLFQIAPRVMIATDAVAATGLVTEASRVRYRLLAAGDVTSIEALADWARPRLPANAGLIDAREARPELESAVERASRFLHLAALTTLLVAGAAIALASRRLVERQTDAVAIMRCLGAPRYLLTRIFALRLLLFGLLSGLVGCLVGWLGHQGLVLLLADWFGSDLPPASLKPVAIGIGSGLVALAGFALPPLLQLSGVPPLRALRRDLGAPRTSVAIAAAAAAGALILLVLWQAGDIQLAWKLLAGVAAALIGLLALGALMVWLAHLATGRSRGIWRLGLAGLARRPGTAILQIVGFGLGILALLLLAVVRLDLLQGWQASLPANTPNRFLINIQPDEVAPLQDFLTANQVALSGIYPMIRGRLTSIGGHEVDPAAFADPRAQRLAEREFNLSYGDTPQPDNEIIAGQWWDTDSTKPQFSVEEGLAQTLGIALGDELRFWVAGREVTAPVTSLRRVHWDSFNVNFFVIASPALLREMPTTYVTSFFLAAEREALASVLLRQFPSLTLIDVGTLLAQVRGIIERGVSAVEYVFVFTLAAGLLVMYSGIQASLTARRTEHGVLRTLGASRSRLLHSLMIEFTLTGLLAGLMASLFAELTGWLLARELLGLAFHFNPWLWLFGVGGSAVLIGAAGTLATYALLVRPPLQALRQGT